MDLNEKIKKVNSWLEDLSKVLNVELSLDATGCCAFQVGKETVISLEVSQEIPLFHLYSTLIPFPLNEPEKVVFMMIRALELNAFQTMTHGGTIATLPGGGSFIFCYSHAIEGCNSERFSSILGGFLTALETIKPLLSEPLGFARESSLEGPKLSMRV